MGKIVSKADVIDSRGLISPKVKRTIYTYNMYWIFNSY